MSGSAHMETSPVTDSCSPGRGASMRDALNSSSPVKITLFSCYCGLGHLQFALSDDKGENRRPPFVRSTLNFPRTDYHVIQNPGRRVWSTPDWESSLLTRQCDNSPPTSLTMAWVTRSQSGGHFFFCFFLLFLPAFFLSPSRYLI